MNQTKNYDKGSLYYLYNTKIPYTFFKYRGLTN